MLNAACQTAIQLGKINFVALLLRHGATPSLAELVHEMIRFCEHPTIQQYFCGWSKENWTADDPDLKLTSMEWHYDYSKEKVITYIATGTLIVQFRLLQVVIFPLHMKNLTTSPVAQRV